MRAEFWVTYRYIVERLTRICYGIPYSYQSRGIARRDQGTTNLDFANLTIGAN